MGNTLSRRHSAAGPHLSSTSVISANAAPKPPARRRRTFPWEDGLKGLQFLKFEPVCRPKSQLGLPPGNEMRYSASYQAILFSLQSSVVIFDTAHKRVREVRYNFEVSSWQEVAHTLSPDKKILVQWRKEQNIEDEPWVIEAIDIESNTIIASLQGLHQCTRLDTFRSVWSSNDVIYIPDSKQGIITCWSIKGNYAATSDIITPLSTVAHHSQLIFHITEDRKWWVANGRTEVPDGETTGHIQVHDVESNESRVILGVACCIAEVEVYDRKKSLLFSCTSNREKLSVSFQQLDNNAPGDPFEQVDVSVTTITPNDHPKTVRVLEGLPIVVVNTGSNAAYFFEIHTGTYLFSQAFAPGTIWAQREEQQSILVNREDTDTILRVSVNDEDLIAYVRQVLQNHTLASGIAIRTGLSGADELIIDDIYGSYKELSETLSR